MADDPGSNLKMSAFQPRMMRLGSGSDLKCLRPELASRRSSLRRKNRMAPRHRHSRKWRLHQREEFVIIDSVRTFAEWFVEFDCVAKDVAPWHELFMRSITQWMGSLGRAAEAR